MVEELRDVLGLFHDSELLLLEGVIGGRVLFLLADVIGNARIEHGPCMPPSSANLMRSLAAVVVLAVGSTEAVDGCVDGVAGVLGLISGNGMIQRSS